eukprot:1159707-Lingulodinium_polyedra.AAC.1
MARVTARWMKAGAAAACVFQPTAALAICGVLDYVLPVKIDDLARFEQYVLKVGDQSMCSTVEWFLTHGRAQD